MWSETENETGLGWQMTPGGGVPLYTSYRGVPPRADDTPCWCRLYIWISFQMKTDSILVVMVLFLAPVATAFFSLNDCESVCYYQVKHCLQSFFLRRCFGYCEDTFSECKKTCVKRSKEDPDSTSRIVAKWNLDQSRSWHISWKFFTEESLSDLCFVYLNFLCT